MNEKEMAEIKELFNRSLHMVAASMGQTALTELGKNYYREVLKITKEQDVDEYTKFKHGCLVTLKHLQGEIGQVLAQLNEEQEIETYKRMVV